MITKEQVAKLLGRSLTSVEEANFDLYIKIVTERLEDLLCFSLCSNSEEHTYESRDGYRTLYVAPFRGIISISVNDSVIESSEYTVKQNGKSNRSWYNSIEFKSVMDGEYDIVVDADWGFGKLPVDLQLLIARFFAQGSLDNPSNADIKSKKIEDFTVTFKDGSTFDDFLSTNQSILNKYSICDMGAVTHGRLYDVYNERLYIPRT